MSSHIVLVGFDDWMLAFGVGVRSQVYPPLSARSVGRGAEIDGTFVSLLLWFGHRVREQLVVEKSFVSHEVRRGSR